jgi:serine phosphatase RsbU (regulator of sigma subunit)
MRLARGLQGSFLPLSLPSFPAGVPEGASALRFHWVYRSGRGVRADFFRVVRLSDWAVGVMVCDVMGQGIRAALMSAMIRNWAESLEEWMPEPGTFLTRLNRLLVRGGGGSGRRDDSELLLFATACCGVIDLQRQHVRVANAASPYPVRVGRKPRRVEVLGAGESPGPLLGVFETAVYRTREYSMAAGDTVWMFSDGVFKVEDPQGRVLGERRLMNWLKGQMGVTPRRLGRAVVEFLERHASGTCFGDDVCLIGVEIDRMADAL